MHVCGAVSVLCMFIFMCVVYVVYMLWHVCVVYVYMCMYVCCEYAVYVYVYVCGVCLWWCMCLCASMNGVHLYMNVCACVLWSIHAYLKGYMFVSAYVCESVCKCRGQRSDSMFSLNFGGQGPSLNLELTI